MATAIRYEGFCLICDRFGDEYTLRRHPCATEEEKRQAQVVADVIDGVAWFRWIFRRGTQPIDWLLLREHRQ